MTLIFGMALLVSVLLLLSGLVPLDKARGTTETKRTGNSSKVKKTPTSIEAEVFVGKKVAVQRKGSISAQEVGRLRAEGETNLPRAVARIVFGFGLIIISVGALVLSLAGATAGSVLFGAVCFGSGLFLMFGWFRQERIAKASFLDGSGHESDDEH